MTDAPLEAALQGAEAALGRRLPAAYRSRLGRDNGGEVRIDAETWFLFPVRDERSRRSLSRTAQDVIVETRIALETGLGFPEDGLAIGANGAGDLLTLRAKGGDGFERHVYVWRLRGGVLEAAGDVDDVFG